LIIDSPALAQQVAARFDAMVQPVNSYRLELRPNAAGGSPSLMWHTQEDAKTIAYDSEPAKSNWQRFQVNVLSLLPLDKEL
jgi:putative cardiolipin synthase